MKIRNTLSILFFVLAISPLFSQSCIGDSMRVQWLIYFNVDGADGLDAMYHLHAYPKSPDRVNILNSAATPGNYSNNYGGVLRGYLKAPETGQYTFNITGDDDSILFLSTDSLRSNLVEIASIPEWTAEEEFDKFASQTSVSITLVAGEYYYFEGRYREYTGGDFLRIHWKTPSSNVNDPWEVIFGSHIYEALCEEVCPLKNTAFDDGDPNTINDKTDGLCNCFGDPISLPSCVGTRSHVQAHYFDSIPGWWLQNLTDDPDFPLSPSRSELLDGLSGPLEVRDSFGTQVKAMLYAPVTGDYYFNVTGANQVGLKLSPDMDPANAVDLIYMDGTWANEYEHDKWPTQTSGAVPLVAGNFYYIELLHKENNSGNERFDVFWKTPFIADNQWRYLDGTYIYSYACDLACIPEGTPCDDGITTTFDDQYDANCNCVGTPCADPECSNALDYIPYEECAATDEHSTSEADAWLSCQPMPNPNTARGVSHWIQYDLGDIYALQDAQVWNYNVAGSTAQGFENVVIDYSADGQTWIELGVYNWAQATGSNDYNGFGVPDFSGIAAQYILFTALDNFEESNCMGISEISFAALPCEQSGLACDDQNPDTNNDQYNDYCACVGTPMVFNDCEDHILIINDNPIATGTYDAIDFIESAGKVRPGNNVNFIAGVEITLNVGFEVNPDAEFLAEIIPCDNSASGSTSSLKLAITPPVLDDSQTWLKIATETNNTTISYNLTNKEEIQINIYTLSGKLISQILKQSVEKGTYNKKVSTRHLPAGMYQVILQTENENLKERMMIVK